MEEFQQRLSEAEEAVYGQRRGGQREGENTASGGWRKGEEETRNRQRRKEGTEEDRGRWRKNERDPSPQDRGRHHAGRGEERGRYWGREEERGRDLDRCREKDKDRERDRGRNRERDGGRDRDWERHDEKDRDRDRYRDRDGGEDGERNRERDRPSAASSSSGQNWSQRSLSLGSLKSRFLKPSEDDDSGEGGLVSKPFLKTILILSGLQRLHEVIGPIHVGLMLCSFSVNFLNRITT